MTTFINIVTFKSACPPLFANVICVHHEVAARSAAYAGKAFSVKAMVVCHYLNFYYIVSHDINIKRSPMSLYKLCRLILIRDVGAGSVAGVHAAANIFSLIQTCKAYDVDPYSWLRHVLTELPQCTSVDEIEKLLLFYFSKKN